MKARNYKNDFYLEVIEEEKLNYKVPNNISDKLFTKLEIDLLNNYESTIMLMKVLYQYSLLITKILEERIERVERRKLLLLLDRIKTEERRLGLSIIVDFDFLSMLDKNPIYADSIISDYEKAKNNHYVNSILMHISCSGIFTKKTYIHEDVIFKFELKNIFDL